MLVRLRFFIEQAITGLWRSIGVTSLSIFTIGLALGLLATFGIAITNLGRVADQLGREVGLSAYLTNDIDGYLADAHAKKIEQWPDVAEARYVTSTAAMAWLRTSLGEDAVVLEGLPVTVLPPSIEVRLDDQAWTAERVEGIAVQLRKLDGVQDVRYGQEDIERVNALLRFVRIAALIIAIALTLATVLIVSNTIRLTVYARRDEIEIMSLIGATNIFVRTPFVIEGAIQGLLGGLLAFASLVAARGAISEGIQRGLSYAYGPIQLEFLPFDLLLWLLLFGTLLGLVGSALAVGKFVKV